MATTNSNSYPTGDDSIHRNILRVQTNEDVFKKYEVVSDVGSGSMGSVARVRIKQERIGGSAFNPKNSGGGSAMRGVFGKVKKAFALKKADKKNNSASLHRSEKSTSGGEYNYALKSIHLDRVSPVFLEELKNEIRILRSLDHPNVVKAHEVYLCKNKQIYLVLELCDGGDLFTRSPYSEKEAAKIVSQLCSAIRYLHEHGIVHRDLKYENIMFENTSPDAAIKVIDFGLSKKFLGKPGTMTERCGTIYTMSPQVLQGVYTSQADLWAIGVLSYMLLSSSKPFFSRKKRKMIDLIMRGKVYFDGPTWTNISAEGKDFVQKLLVVDPRQRMTAKDALHHPWIVDREKWHDDKPSEEVLSKLDKTFINYGQTSQLKKLALTVIAHRSTAQELLQLRKIFDSFDTERNGVLTFEEFKQALEKMGYADEDINDIFESIDLNQNGQIMYTEFLAATIEAHGHIEEDRIAEAFDRIDSDDTGFISRENLKQALGKDCTPEEVDEIIKAADKNKDGKISFAEFLESFREQTEAMVECVESMEFGGDDDSLRSGDETLVGLDAKIPGGKFDTDLSASAKAGEKLNAIADS